MSHKYITKVVWYILVQGSALNNTMSMVSGVRPLATGFLLLVSGLNFTEQFGRIRPCGLGPKEAYAENSPTNDSSETGR